MALTNAMNIYRLRDLRGPTLLIWGPMSKTLDFGSLEFSLCFVDVLAFLNLFLNIIHV